MRVLPNSRTHEFLSFDAQLNRENHIVSHPIDSFEEFTAHSLTILYHFTLYRNVENEEVSVEFCVNTQLTACPDDVRQTFVMKADFAKQLCNEVKGEDCLNKIY